MENLLELRNEIDAIDKEIVDLFQKRMKISSEVAEYKISTGKKVFDRAREAQKIQAVTELADNDFNRHGIEELFQQIMSMSRKLQYQLLAQNGVVGRLPLSLWKRSRNPGSGWSSRAWKEPTVRQP